MTRIFLLGDAPLPFMDSAKRPAGGLRTWQFLKPLRDARHQVQVVFFSRPDFWLNNEMPAHDQFGDYIDRDDPQWQKRTQKLLDDFKPDVVVAVNSLACERACRLYFEVPLWADINGSPVLEAQAQAWRIGSDGLLPHFWAREQKILQMADMISTCSTRQKYATLGMMGALGRLNSRTMGEENVVTIPNLTENFGKVDEVLVDSTPLVRGAQAPQDAILVNMVGGWWNTWLDEETLFAALEQAMSQNEKIWFVAGGGAVPGLTLAPLDNFRARIAQSPFKDRFVLLGWVPTADMAQIYREVDICINVDRMCADTMTGARNRMTEWAKFGLPIITTRGTEVAEQMIAQRAAVGVDIGDSTYLADAILWLAQDQNLRHKIGQAAQKLCSEKWNYRAGMKEFMHWIAHPRSAGDFTHEVDMRTGWWNTKVKAGWRYFRANGFGKAWGKMKQMIGNG